MLSYSKLSNILLETSSKEMGRQFFTSCLLFSGRQEPHWLFSTLRGTSHFVNTTDRLFLVVCKQIHRKFLTLEYISYREHELCFGLRFLIIFKISFAQSSTVESDWHVFSVRIEGSLLLLLTREHCLVKNSLKVQPFP